VPNDDDDDERDSLVNRVRFLITKMTVQQVFSPSTSVVPCQHQSSDATYSFHIYHRSHIILAVEGVTKDEAKTNAFSV